MSQDCIPPQRPLDDGTYLVSVPVPSALEPSSTTTQELFLGLSAAREGGELPIVTLAPGEVSLVAYKVLNTTD